MKLQIFMSREIILKICIKLKYKKALSANELQTFIKILIKRSVLNLNIP
jgi:hypothetical protein